MTDQYEPTPWIKYAACVGGDPNLFFPGQGAGSTVIDRARAICATCVVRSSCLEHAIRHKEPGIWGGTTAKERNTIRRARRRAVDAA